MNKFCKVLMIENQKSCPLIKTGQDFINLLQKSF